MPSESTEQIPEVSEETAEELPPEEDQGFQVLDQDGNPLSVNLEEVDDPEALEAQVDFSRVSGELVWLQDIHVETEGTVNVRIRLENLDGKVVTVVHFPDTGEVEYPEAEILVIPGYNHLGFLNRQPETYAGMVREFLKTE